MPERLASFRCCTSWAGSGGWQTRRETVNKVVNDLVAVPLPIQPTHRIAIYCYTMIFRRIHTGNNSYLSTGYCQVECPPSRCCNFSVADPEGVQSKPPWSPYYFHFRGEFKKNVCEMVKFEPHVLKSWIHPYFSR